MNISSLRGLRAARLCAPALLLPFALAACSDDASSEDTSDTAGTSSDVSSDAGSDTEDDTSSDDIVGESPEVGSDEWLDQLDVVVGTSVSDVEGYEFDGTTLTVTFSSGSVNEPDSNCLLVRSAAQGLGLSTDSALVMAYPDGEKECGA